ncbi:MAG TPA: hypothetical protein VFS19_02815 [Planctomycetota bacterium]|nr:hypothetical protein [Planctomycetota bacterium]
MEVVPAAKDLVQFARQELEQGRGEWWIVSEMEKRWQIDEPNARAIVAAVSPAVYQSFLRRRRVYLICGVLLMGLGAIPPYYLGSQAALLSAMVVVPGAALIAYGWPGLKRRPLGDAPTSIPGAMKPFRPPLLSSDPFEWKK